MNQRDKTIIKRKDDHLEIFKNNDCSSPNSTTWLEHVRLVHSALPELSVEDIDISTNFAQRDFATPLFITGITGGTAKAKEINIALAKVAEKYGMAFGLGSQRAMLESQSLSITYNVRKFAPSVFIAGNLGAVQLMTWHLDDLYQMLESVSANALCIHLNPAQELLQKEGDRDFSRILERLERLTKLLDVPVIVKEVGCGLSREVAQQLIESHVQYLDCAGVGGTSWPVIELLRSTEENGEDKNVFADWGIPTAASCMELSGLQAEFIASGGIRNGLEAAKAIALGASMVGIAGGILQEYFSGGEKAVDKKIQSMLSGLKMAMILTSCQNIQDLQRCPKVILGDLQKWCEQRDILTY